MATHYSWHRSHFLEWLTTPHTAGLCLLPLPPLSIICPAVFKVPPLEPPFSPLSHLLTFPTLGNLLILLLPPSPTHSSLTSFPWLSPTCLSFGSQFRDLLRYLEHGQFPFLTPPMTHISPHSQHSSYTVVFSC